MKLIMKHIKILSAFLMLFTAIGFTSCDTEPVDPVLLDSINNPVNPTTPVGPALFKVDFSGQTFVATSTLATIDQGLIAISGARGANGEEVGLAVRTRTTGTYTGDDVIMSYSPSAASDLTYNNFDFSNGQSSGTITITSINTTAHTISGNFSFTGWAGDEDQNLPSIAFTNGTFENIPYNGDFTENPNPDNEYVRATVNGTAKNYGITSGIVLNESLNVGGTIADPSESVQLVMDVNTTQGTYPITNNFGGYRATYQSGSTMRIARTGTLTIISNSNGWIKGTFSFTAEDEDGGNSIEVTGGEFNVEYD
jgi:hypothetical protein